MPTVADAATLPLALDEILIAVDFLLALVVVGLIACVLGCLASFAALLLAEDHQDAAHLHGGLVALVLALLAAPASLEAQIEPPEASRVVKPCFTRIFRNDSVPVSASYALSPDGRHVAIAPEVRRGASLWRIDLEAVLRREAPEGEGGGGGS